MPLKWEKKKLWVEKYRGPDHDDGVGRSVMEACEHQAEELRLCPGDAVES